MLHDRPFNDQVSLPVYSNGDGFAASVYQRADDAVVAVAGEIDMATAKLLRTAIQDASRRGSRVIIDMAETTFIDSAGLHVLLNAHRELGLAPKTLVVRSVIPGLRRVFEITGVDQLLTPLPEPT